MAAPMTASIWNSRNISSPPVVHLPVNSVLGDNATIKQYEATVTDMMTELKLLALMEKEVWFLQRILQTYQNSARNMKWFRESKMICKSGERLLQMKLQDLATALLPITEEGSSMDSTASRWPTRQMLEYFLVRLLGFAGLCQYIWSMGYKTNELLLQNMELKILFYRNFCKMSVISRMQIICQHLLEKTCKWYKALYPWLKCLPKLESQWLPEGVTLPVSVEEILGSKLNELRNIVAKSKETSGEGEENKSTLEKVFGSEEILPRFVLEEEVTMRSAQQTEVEQRKHAELSLDDIFGGLVENQAKKATNHSRPSPKETEHDDVPHQEGKLSKPGTTHSVCENGAPTVTVIQQSRIKYKIHQDIGVPVSREVPFLTESLPDQLQQEHSKKKKKKKKRKRKMNENMTPDDTEWHREAKVSKDVPVKQDLPTKENIPGPFRHAVRSSGTAGAGVTNSERNQPNTAKRKRKKKRNKQKKT